MSGILRSCLGAALLLLPASAWGQATLIHVTSCGAGVFPSTTCTIPATKAGNLIVVGWTAAYGNTPTITSVTDNAGNSYVEAGAARAVDSSAGQMVDMWYASNNNGGATTITITPNPSGTQGAGMIWEFSNINTAAPLGQTAVLNNQTATTTPTGSPLAVSSGDVIISIMVPGGSTTGIHSGNAFTSDQVFFGVGWAHLVAPSAGTYTAQWDTSSGTYANTTVSFKAGTASGSPSSACDLAVPYGTIDSADVNAAINMTLGMAPCTANIAGTGVCNAVVVQRVVNAMPPPSGTNTCLTGSGAIAHSVSLNWTASTSSGLSGYKVYRGTASGQYTLLASPGLVVAYTDTTVQAGQTYYYVTTAVDVSGNESSYSNEAKVTVPTP